MGHRNTKQPRKAYRPRFVDADPVGLALTMAAKLLPQQWAEAKAEMQASFDAFRTGCGSNDHWRHLADRLNVAEALAQMHIAGDHADTFERGQAALAAVHQRAHGAAKSWTLRGPELAALDDALFVHGVQLEHCSQGELQAAIGAVQRRVWQALQGNAGAGVLVLSTGGGGGAAVAAAGGVAA